MKLARSTSVLTLIKDCTRCPTGSIVRAYERCKAGLSSDALLVHYDTAKRDLRLACDTSSSVSITPGIMGYQHNFVSQKLTVDISGNMLTLNELSGMEI